MTINYIYDEQGTLEYAVVPVAVWESVKQYVPANELVSDVFANNETKKNFDPSKYYGMLSHLDLDIEQELLDMRKGWLKNT